MASEPNETHKPSKIARDIVHELFGDFETLFDSAGVVDGVLAGRTIKKSEVERLKNSEKHLCERNFRIGMDNLRLYFSAEDLKDKLWNAEQEVHDLKRREQAQAERIKILENNVFSLGGEIQDLTRELDIVRAANLCGFTIANVISPESAYV